VTLDARRCPLCGDANACAIAEGKTTCWCFERTIGQEVLMRIPEDARNVACVCARCAAGSSAAGAESVNPKPPGA